MPHLMPSSRCEFASYTLRWHLRAVWNQARWRIVEGAVFRALAHSDCGFFASCGAVSPLVL